MFSFRAGSLVSALLLTGLATSATLGQGFSGGRGRVGERVVLLLKKSQIQQEVALSAEQSASLTEIVEADRAASNAVLRDFDYAAFDKLPQTEQKVRREALRQKTDELNRQSDERVKSLLNSNQWARLNEIRIQQEGVWALARKEIQKQLGFSPDQVATIEALVKKANELPQNSEPDLSPEGRRKAREANEARRQVFEKEMAAVLTKDQAATWSKLKGEPFEMSR